MPGRHTSYKSCPYRGRFDPGVEFPGRPFSETAMQTAIELIERRPASAGTVRDSRAQGDLVEVMLLRAYLLAFDDESRARPSLTT